MTKFDFEVLLFVEKVGVISEDQLIKKFPDECLCTKLRLNRLSEPEYLNLLGSSLEYPKENSSFLDIEEKDGERCYYITDLGRMALLEYKDQEELKRARRWEYLFLKVAPIIISVIALVVSALSK